jgi:hypothetical protein
LAKSKRPATGKHGPPSKRASPRKAKPSAEVKPQKAAAKIPTRRRPPLEERFEAARAGRTLLDDARKVLERSGWQKTQQAQLSRVCRELVARLNEACPMLVVGRPLKPSEVAGEIAVNPEDFRTILTTAAGAQTTPRTVWSDGTNELLIETARISVKIEDGLVHVQIPVACEETGAQTITVSFATGSDANAAGLILATDTIPMGPPQIVEIWGEAVVALAWTSLLKVVSTLADVAGVDQDGAGLVPAGFAASGNGVKVLVMARHEMDRVVK